MGPNLCTHSVNHSCLLCFFPYSPYSTSVIQLRMQPAGAHRDVDQLPRFRFDGDNRMEFLSGWPDICAHFGFRALLLDNPVLARPRLAHDQANMEEVLEWDRLNELAKSKLKFYLTPDVYKVVWSGDQMTAKEFYERLHTMFIRGDICDQLRYLNKRWRTARKDPTRHF